MKKVWITYAWADNQDADVDFIIQEIDNTELEVKFDRRNLVPGQRLWTQIGGFITDPAECDAWCIVLSRESISSQRCIEELSYALDRALTSNGAEFPIFALLHKISPSEMPPALRIRLCIPLENNDWVKQVVAAANKESTGFVPLGLSNFVVNERPHIENHFYMEIRPRFDRISPFRVAVDIGEKESGNVKNAVVGPSGILPQTLIIYNGINQGATLLDGTRVWVWGADNEANSTTSYYLIYLNRPARIWVGDPSKLELLPLDTFDVWVK